MHTAKRLLKLLPILIPSPFCKETFYLALVAALMIVRTLCTFFFFNISTRIYIYTYIYTYIYAFYFVSTLFILFS